MLGLTIDGSGINIKSNQQLLHSRLERLFFSPIGESIGFLNQGSRIQDYFWESDTVENAQAILHEVKWLLKAHEPSVIPTSMLVKFSPFAGGTALIIELGFYWADNENEEFNLQIIKIKER